MGGGFSEPDPTQASQLVLQPLGGAALGSGPWLEHPVLLLLLPKFLSAVGTIGVSPHHCCATRGVTQVWSATPCSASQLLLIPTPILLSSPLDSCPIPTLRVRGWDNSPCWSWSNLGRGITGVLGCAAGFLGCRQAPNPQENLPGGAGLQELIPHGVMVSLRSALRIPCLCPMDMEGTRGAWWSHPGGMLLPSIPVPLGQPSWGWMKGLEVVREMLSYKCSQGSTSPAPMDHSVPAMGSPGIAIPKAPPNREFGMFQPRTSLLTPSGCLSPQTQGDSHKGS